MNAHLAGAAEKEIIIPCISTRLGPYEILGPPGVKGDDDITARRTIDFRHDLEGRFIARSGNSPRRGKSDFWNKWEET